jgi:C-terminal processing protease CtpA/Prc
MDSSGLRRQKTTPLGIGMFLVLLWTGIAIGGEFGGIGAAVVPVATGELVVVKVVEGSPAAGAGLAPGDLIVQVDGQSLRGTEFPAVVRNRLWGPPGKAVELIYRRPGQAGEKKVHLRRVPMDPQRGQAPGVELIVPEAGNGQEAR